MKKYTTLLLFASILFCIKAQAQHTISGTVTGEHSKVVSDAIVSLLNQSDSSWLQTVYSTEGGVYNIEDVAAGKYVLNVQRLGYSNVMKPVVVINNSVKQDFSLQSDQLNEAVVKSRRVAIQTELGKTVVNVSKEMKTGKSLLDLLRDVPGVTVSPTGDVSIAGKQSVTLMINDQPVELSGKDLAAYLRGVTASNVDKIELMTQPSAKYDASGNSGILFVKLNKQKKQGWSGNANAVYSQARYPFVSANGRAAYRKNKVGVHMSPGFYRGEGFLISDKERISKDILSQKKLASVKEDAFLREVFFDYATEFGVDYDISDKTQISGTIRGTHHPNKQWDNVSSKIEDYNNSNQIYNRSVVGRGFTRNDFKGTLFLKHEIDSTQKLTVNGYYFTQRKDIYQNITGVNYDEQGNVLTGGLNLRNDIPIASSIYSINADYTANVKKDTKLEAGVKSSYVPIDEANNFKTLANNNWVKDVNRTNHFLYNEYINAGYVNASTQKGKWQAQVGLRVEHTYAEGHETTQDNKFKRNYASVFPTAFVSCRIDSNNTVEVNYGKRIKRPFYRELNPFTNFASQYVVSSGNPYLLPMFTHHVELKHNCKGKLITTLEFDQTINGFTEQLLFDATSKVSNYSTTNNGRSRGGALAALYNGEIRNWLSLSVVGRASYNEFQTRYNNESYRSSRMSMYMSIDTQLRLKNGWAASLHSRYAGPYMVDAFREVSGSMWLSSNISKSMLNDTLVVKLSMQDPFNWYRFNQTVALPNNEVTETSMYATQNVTLALTYNFGKNENKRARGKLNSDEMQRM